MAKKLSGTVLEADSNGFTIRVDENPGFAQGDKVIVEIEKIAPMTTELWRQFHEAVGGWKDDPSIPAIFDEIEKERRRGIQDHNEQDRNT